MAAVLLAMVVTGFGTASLLWPAGPAAALLIAPVCAVLAAMLVAPHEEASRR